MDHTYNLGELFKSPVVAYEVELTIKNRNAEVIGFQLFNEQGDEVDFYYNLLEKKFAMDRTKSGSVDFSPHFLAVTTAPLVLRDCYKLRLIIDSASIEAFGDDGDFAMTNLVYPVTPYKRMSFYSKGGTYEVVSCKIYPLNK